MRLTTTAEVEEEEGEREGVRVQEREEVGVGAPVNSDSPRAGPQASFTQCLTLSEAGAGRSRSLPPPLSVQFVLDLVPRSESSWESPKRFT